MSRGGARRNSGRKPGSPNKVRLEARERHRKILDAHEPAILKRLLAVRDERVLIEVYRLLLTYADGAPKAAIAVTHSAPELQSFLTGLALRRLGEAADPPRALALPPAGERATIDVEKAAPDPKDAGFPTLRPTESCVQDASISTGARPGARPEGDS